MNRNLFFSAMMVMLAFSFFQCKNKENEIAKIQIVDGHDVIVCDVNDIKDTIDFKLSDIIKNCEMVQLETNDKSLFEEAHYVSVSPNYILIKSRGQLPVKLFGRDGQFLRDIGSIGRGPNEYGSLYGIQIQEEENRIYLTPFARAKEILVFDLEGQALPSIPLVYQQTKCKVYVDNDKVTVLSMPFNDQIPIAFQQTLKGELLQEVPAMPHQILKPDFSSEVSSLNNAGAFDLFILPWGGLAPDTLYHYETVKNQLVPKYVLTGLDKKNEGAWTYEYKNHFISYLWGDRFKNSKAIVDKKSFEGHFFRLINDFYGNIEMNKLYMSNNGFFISGVPAFQLMDDIDLIIEENQVSSKDMERLAGIRKSLHEGQNEILFIGEMN